MSGLPGAEPTTTAAVFDPTCTSTAARRDHIRALSTLAEIDPFLLAEDLPVGLRREAGKQQAALERLQGAAGDDKRLRQLLVEREVAGRPGAARACRRLIAEAAQPRG